MYALIPLTSYIVGNKLRFYRKKKTMKDSEKPNCCKKQRGASMQVGSVVIVKSPHQPACPPTYRRRLRLRHFGNRRHQHIQRVLTESYTRHEALQQPPPHSPPYHRIIPQFGIGIDWKITHTEPSSISKCLLTNEEISAVTLCLSNDPMT